MITLAYFQIVQILKAGTNLGSQKSFENTQVLMYLFDYMTFYSFQNSPAYINQSFIV